jgi:hypothetical protein
MNRLHNTTQAIDFIRHTFAKTVVCSVELVDWRRLAQPFQ